MQATAQKETPDSGCNHMAGVKQNNPDILPDIQPSINISTTDYLNERAAATRAQLLSKASTFAALHVPHTLWSRRMKVGTETVLVRLEWPGTLAVFNPKTGDLLARSAPGAPGSRQKQELPRQ